MGWRPDDPIYLHQIIKTQLIINLTVYQFISSKFTTQTTIDYPLWFFLKMIFLTIWVILCWNTLSERVTDICYNTIASTCLRSQWQWLLWWWWWWWRCWWWWLREWWPPLALTETQQPIGARLKTYQSGKRDQINLVIITIAMLPATMAMIKVIMTTWNTPHVPHCHPATILWPQQIPHLLPTWLPITTQAGIPSHYW